MRESAGGFNASPPHGASGGALSPGSDHASRVEQEYRLKLEAQTDAREEAERQLKDVQHQLQQERARSQLKEESADRDRQLWAAQEEAFKKRISQLEWKEEMYNSLQLEKDAKDRELLEWKEAFDELEKERDEAVRKAQEKERSDMKDENDAVQIFIGKVLEENDALQDKIRELDEFRNMRSKLVEAEVDRDIFRKSLSLYKEFFEFVRNNGCLNHQGHTQWGIISHKVKCSESSREARVERSLSPAVRRTMPRSDSAHGSSATSPQNTPRGRSRSQGATLRDSRYSYIPRTGCDNDLTVGLPPRPPLYKTTSTKKLSPTKKELATIPLTMLIKRIEDAERKSKESEEALSKELARSKELEIRWKAVCNKKEKDLAEARQKMARLQVEAAPPRSPHCRPISLGDLDSVSVVSRAESQDLDETYGTFGKETAVGTFSTIEKDLDNRELMTQLAVARQEAKILSEELAAAQEHARKIDFDRIEEKEEARCAMVEGERKHEERLQKVREEFDNEKSVIWKKYQDLSSENSRLSHELNLSSRNLETIQVTVNKVLKEMDPMHCVIEDLSQDVQTLVSRHGGATLSVARTPSGREIVPISRSTSVTDSIVGAIESVSSSLATRCAQMEAIRTGVREANSKPLESMRDSMSGSASKASLVSDEDDKVAHVTVKLDWTASQHVQVVETGNMSEASKEKKKSSSRRQLEEARARETEMLESLDQQKREIDRLHRDLELQDEARRRLREQLDDLLSTSEIRGQALGRGMQGIPSPMIPGAGNVCKNCMNKLTVTDVEKSLDLALALGQAEQELGDRERKIVHLESRIMELEEEREDDHNTKMRCWVVDSKFDALETQGSVGSRNLYDAVVGTNKMLEYLKQDVKRSCSGIVYELSEINDALRRAVEIAQQDFTFLHLETLRTSLADATSSENVQHQSSQERTSARQRRRLADQAKLSPSKPSLLMGHGVAAGMISRGDARDQDRDLEVKAREAKIDEHGAASEIEHKSPSGPALRRPLESAEQLGDISPISTALSSTAGASPGLDRHHESRSADDCVETSVNGVDGMSDVSDTEASKEVLELSNLLQHRKQLVEAAMEQNAQSLRVPEALPDNAAAGNTPWRLLITVESAQLVAEAVRTPYVLVTLEAKSKEKSSRTDLSRKTDAGGQNIKRDARTGNFEVTWSETFEFCVAQLDQKFAFTWFDTEEGDGSRRPSMLGCGKIPISRLMSKLPEQGARAQYVLPLANQKNKSVGSISIFAERASSQ